MFVRFSSGATPPAADAATGAAPPPLPTPASPAAPQAMPRGDARVGFEPTPPRRAKGSKRRRRHEEPGQPLVVRLFGFVRDMAVGAVVTWLLLVALAIGVVMAMDVPGMLAAGVPDTGIPAHITQGLGFDGWPHLFRIVGNGVGLATLLLAALVLIVARRRTYGLHMMRAMAGVAVFGLSLMLLGRALSGGEWHRVPGGAALEASSFESADARDPGYVGPQRVVIHMGHGEGVRDMRDVRASFFASLEHFLSDARPGFVTWSGCVGLLAIIMICWPARRAGDRRGARQVAVHQNFGPAVYAPPAPAPAPASAPAAAAAGESN